MVSRRIVEQPAIRDAEGQGYLVLRFDAAGQRDRHAGFASLDRAFPRVAARAGVATARVLILRGHFGLGLKYLKSGGGWFFCAGMSNPSALST